jgi:hypothetical protein
MGLLNSEGLWFSGREKVFGRRNGKTARIDRLSAEIR